MRSILRCGINVIGIALLCWTAWDTARFYIASPSSLLYVAAITVALLVGIGALSIIIPKKQRSATLRGFHFAMMISFGAMFVVAIPVFFWTYLRAGFSWEVFAVLIILPLMSFASYREWRT